ncbi:MAG TPA: HAMP domain-containing sensor histidine kinase [Usitatibacter sp.]|nr:HAMP domain-containing sensor histidine kinase [Usitatibacter sp.]
MLHEFLLVNRNDLIARCMAKVLLRPAHARIGASPRPRLIHGIPEFIDQLIATLKVEQTAMPLQGHRTSGPAGGAHTVYSDLSEAATLHGRELWLNSFSVDQVVHDYGDLCQAITELAYERKAGLSIEEFRILNRCLDNAIADAVTEFSYERDVAAAKVESSAHERRAVFAHELRDSLHAASLAFHAIKAGSVGVNGSTGAALERSLATMSSLIERSIMDARAAAALPPRNELLSLADFIADAGAIGLLEARERQCRLVVSHVDPSLAVEVDRDLLMSAVMNLLTNAFKFTCHGTEVTLSAHPSAEHVFIEVSDNCGGLPPGSQQSMFLPFTQGSGDRSGLGLGLAISRRNIEAQAGTLTVRDVPGTGCVFVIKLPRRIVPITVAAH